MTKTRKSRLTPEQQEEAAVAKRLEEAKTREASLQKQLKVLEKTKLNQMHLRERMVPRLEPGPVQDAMTSVMQTAEDGIEKIIRMVKGDLEVVHMTAQEASLHKEMKRRQENQ